MQYVFAGSSREHVDYCRKHKLTSREVKYIYKAEQLKDLHGISVKKTGTWFLNPDLIEIERQIARLESEKSSF